jgi:arylsulfatase
MATFVDVGNATYPTEFGGEKIVPMQGVSFAPLIRGEKWERGKPLFWQWRKGHAIRDGKWKLVTHGKKWELYDMDADRTEMTDLATRHPDRVATMSEAWDTWFASTR